MGNVIRNLSQTAVVLLLLIGSCTQMATSTDPRTGKPAPDVTLAVPDKHEIKLSDLKGSVVVLDFWATWCPPCRESLPHLGKVSSDPALARRGLKVFAVNGREKSDVATGYVKDNRLPLDVALDLDGAVEDAFKVDNFPTTIIVGRDGAVQHVIEGYSGKDTEDELDAAVEKALSLR